MVDFEVYTSFNAYIPVCGFELSWQNLLFEKGTIPSPNFLYFKKPTKVFVK